MYLLFCSLNIEISPYLKKYVTKESKLSFINIVEKVVRFMFLFEEKCHLKKYKKYRDCDLAWEVYKYIYRHKELINDKEYRSLLDVAEQIIVWHRLSHNLWDDYDGIKLFYRRYVSMLNDEDEKPFVLSESVKNHLFLIKQKHDETIKNRFIAFLKEKY